MKHETSTLVFTSYFILARCGNSVLNVQNTWGRAYKKPWIKPVGQKWFMLGKSKY